MHKLHPHSRQGQAAKALLLLNINHYTLAAANRKWHQIAHTRGNTTITTGKTARCFKNQHGPRGSKYLPKYRM